MSLISGKMVKESKRAQDLLKRSQEVAQIDPAQQGEAEIQAQAPQQQASIGLLDQSARALGGDSALLGDAIRRKASRVYDRGIDEMVTRGRLAAPEQRQRLKLGALKDTFGVRDVNAQIQQQNMQIEAEKDRQRNAIFGQVFGGILGLAGNLIPIPGAGAVTGMAGNVVSKQMGGG